MTDLSLASRPGVAAYLCPADAPEVDEVPGVGATDAAAGDVIPGVGATDAVGVGVMPGVGATDPASVDLASGVDGAPGAPTRRQEIATGIRLSFAAGLGMFPIGIAFGLLVVQTGLPWWVAPGLSIFLFSGSVELLLVGLMAVGTPLATIALTAVLVNFRHVFYAFSFPLRVVRHPLARLYSVYALIDEAYAVAAARPGTWSGARLVAIQLAFQSYWVGGGLVGVAIASVLPTRIEGLEFALCALFITLTLDACRSRREVPSLVLAGLSLGLALVLVPDSALFVGLIGFVALLVLRCLLTARTAPAPAGDSAAGDSAAGDSTAGDGSTAESNPADSTAGGGNA
ncbi:AzlC family ABC transporter permease [Brachybacterium fresconis]|uniref:4-azaleucine resistance transporter AzlC n=1 Tax=Brachybacterium fresconis TaxID=173363 RepID=A0ABS4YKN6_9MICO|nr:AzlC family ABC transporter permease [Brachybacterium fresconis]MBP2408957.1 4-azaleucine resistance transporter AzlC [Brachybacterium fresconis]